MFLLRRSQFYDHRYYIEITYFRQPMLTRSFMSFRSNAVWCCGPSEWERAKGRHHKMTPIALNANTHTHIPTFAYIHPNGDTLIHSRTQQQSLVTQRRRKFTRHSCRRHTHANPLTHRLAPPPGLLVEVSATTRLLAATVRQRHDDTPSGRLPSLVVRLNRIWMCWVCVCVCVVVCESVVTEWRRDT